MGEIKEKELSIIPTKDKKTMKLAINLLYEFLFQYVWLSGPLKRESVFATSWKLFFRPTYLRKAIFWTPPVFLFKLCFQK